MLPGAALATSMLVGCQCEQHTSPGAPAGSVALAARAGASVSASSAPAAGKPRVLPPLVAERDVFELDAAGPTAPRQWLAVPIGATTSRPVVLVQQAVDPDGRELCGKLQQSAGGVPFVLCQSLVVSNGGQASLVKPQLAERGLRDALRAAKQRFGPHLAAGPAVFIVISDALELLASTVRREPDFFRRVLTISREASGWSSGTASVFASRGGERALLAVREASSLAGAEHRAVLIERAGAKARAVLFRETLDSVGIARFVEQHWAWLSEDDARFEPAPGGRP